MWATPGSWVGAKLREAIGPEKYLERSVRARRRRQNCLDNVAEPSLMRQRKMNQNNAPETEEKRYLRNEA